MKIRKKQGLQDARCCLRKIADYGDRCCHCWRASPLTDYSCRSARLEPIDQEDQRIQCASFLATRHTRVYTAAALVQIQTFRLIDYQIENLTATGI